MGLFLARIDPENKGQSQATGWPLRSPALRDETWHPYNHDLRHGDAYNETDCQSSAFISGIIERIRGPSISSRIVWALMLTFISFHQFAYP